MDLIGWTYQKMRKRSLVRIQICFGDSSSGDSSGDIYKYTSRHVKTLINERYTHLSVRSSTYPFVVQWSKRIRTKNPINFISSPGL